jgi:hypothetical protein
MGDHVEGRLRSCKVGGKEIRQGLLQCGEKFYVLMKSPWAKWRETRLVLSM